MIPSGGAFRPRMLHATQSWPGWAPPRRVTAVWRADSHTDSDQAAGGKALCSTAKDELLRELVYRKSAVPRIGPQFSTFSLSVKVAILRALWVCPLLEGTYDKRPHGAPAPVP